MDLFMQILGATLIVIGLVGLFITIGFMLYPMYREYRAQYFGKTHGNPASDGQSGETV